MKTWAPVAIDHRPTTVPSESSPYTGTSVVAPSSPGAPRSRSSNPVSRGSELSMPKSPMGRTTARLATSWHGQPMPAATNRTSRSALASCTIRREPPGRSGLYRRAQELDDEPRSSCEIGRLRSRLHDAAGPAMRWIPWGPFRMGSDDFYPDEQPAHGVVVDGFWMDAHPVTNAEFDRFVEAAGYRITAERTPDANLLIRKSPPARGPNFRRSSIDGVESHAPPAGK